MKSSRNKPRFSPVDLMYLASFLDGDERTFLDEVAELGYAKCATLRNVSVYTVKKKAKDLVRDAYNRMEACVQSWRDGAAFGLWRIIDVRDDLENKRFLEEVKQRVKENQRYWHTV